MNIFIDTISSISNFIWDYFLLFALIGTGIFVSIKLKFPQIRYFFKAIKQTFIPHFKGEKDKNAVTSYQSLLVSLSAQLGTGNIVGIGTAITLGGAGSIFWMWVSALLGCGTIFSETVLAQMYSKMEGGKKIGGPAFYITEGFKDKKWSPKLGKFLASFFAVSLIIALGLVGNMVQANSIAETVEHSFQMPVILVGVIVVFSAWYVFAGGIQRIIQFAEKVVPAVVILYLIATVWVLFTNSNAIIPAFKDIFIGAFSPQAIGGGLLGITIKEAVRFGVARGLFSNEAGMGSTPHAHAIAKVKNPVNQGMTSTLSVFIDTFIIGTATALVILVTGANDLGLKGVEIASKAFELSLGSWGGGFLTICLSLFAFTTIIAWYYFGETNIRFLFGNEGVKPYRFLVFVFIILGAVGELDNVWLLADFFNGIMVIPNLIAIWLLLSLVWNKVKDFDKN